MPGPGGMAPGSELVPAGVLVLSNLSPVASSCA